MRRLRAAATPAAFFVGLALTCASLIEVQRWPFVAIGLAGSDFDGVDHAWQPTMTRLLTTDSGFGLIHLVMLALGNAAAIGLVGLVLFGKRKRIGATLLGASALVGGVIVLVTALSSYPPVCDGLPLAAGIFAAFIMTLTVGALLVEAHASGSILPVTIAAAAVSIGMIGVTLSYAGTVARTEVCKASGSVQAPDWPLSALLTLLGFGLLLALVRPRFSTPPASFVMLVAACALAVPALAVAHDERLERHEAQISIAKEITTLPTTWCPDPTLGPLVFVTPTEIYSDGVVLGTTAAAAALEGPLFQQLSSYRTRLEDLHNQGGDVGAIDGTINLYADATTPIPTVLALSRACSRSGYRKLQILSLRHPMARAWTLPLVHAHFCAVQLELEDDGQPITEFANWPALVRAADQAQGRLRISAR